MGQLTEPERAEVEDILAVTSHWADGHVRQVERLSGWLYAGLRPFHGLGAREETLLRAGALLHDVGYPIDPERHHKVSARIIRNQLGPPFDPDQIALIALLARYHRKALPCLRHDHYVALAERDRRIVSWLGGIIRVADGLDRAHNAAVQCLAISTADERLEILVSTRSDRERFRPTAANGRGGAIALASRAAAPVRVDPMLRMDVTAAQRKSDLLARALGRMVSIQAV